MVIGDSTVERSGIGTSVLLLAAQPVGLGDGVGLGVGDGVGLGEGDGEAVGLGVGDGVGVGVGVAPAARLRVQESMRPMSAAAASWTRSFQVPFAASVERLVV